MPADKIGDVDVFGLLLLLGRHDERVDVGRICLRYAGSDVDVDVDVYDVVRDSCRLEATMCIFETSSRCIGFVEYIER